MKKENLKKTSITKRAISLVLALVIGLGTFVSMSAENFRLIDWLELKTFFTAYAEDEPTPEFYRDNELVGLYNPDYTSTDTMYYQIGENGNWTEYTHPFAIPAFQTTAVYAKIGENGAVTGDNFASEGKAIGVYKDSCTDFTITYNNVSFDYTRYYDSSEKQWFTSLYSKYKRVNNNVLLVTLPDSSKLTFVKNSANTYINELNGYILTGSSGGYSVEIDGTTYNLSQSMLNSITDKYNNQIIFRKTPVSLVAPVLYISGTSNSSATNLKYTFSGSVFDPEVTGGEIFDPDDPDGNNTTTNYGGEEYISDPNGHNIIYRYGYGTYPERVIDQTNRVIAKYTYATTDDTLLTKSNDTNISYYNTNDSRNGRVQSVIKNNGEGVTYTYNDAQMSYSTSDSLGNTTTTVYNDAFLPVSYTDEGGNVTTYTYYDNFKLHTETSNGVTVTYTYNSNGDVTSCSSNDTENGENTNYSYDSNNRLIRENTGDVYTYYVYNNNDKVTRTATLDVSNSNIENVPESYDSNLTYDEEIIYNYDSSGRVTQEVTTEGSDSETVQYGYDQYGNTTSVNTQTVENNETTTSSDTYTYDLLGNVLTQNSDNELTTYTYDNAGRTLLVNEAGKCTRTVYDDKGRVVQEIGPEDYNSEDDNLPTGYNNANVGQRYFYDSTDKNQVVREINRLNVETTYTYHTNGVKATEKFDNYRYYYNQLGNITDVKIGAPNASESSLTTYAHYNYDADTNRNTSIEYGNGQTVYYYYDTNGNVTAQRFKASPNAQQETQFEYTYNEDNKLTKKLDYENDRKTVYASDGTVTVYRGTGNSPTLLYTYKDSTTTETVNSEEVTTRTYEQGFAQYVEPRQNGRTYAATSITSEATGNTCTFDINGTEYTKTDTETDGRLTQSVLSETSNNNSFNACDYTYDSDGNITEIEYPNITVQYTYDSEGRIETKSTSGNMANNQHFYYDSKGQIIRCDDSRRNQTTTFEYDSRGNLTKRNFYAYTTGEITENTSTTAETEYTFDYDDNVWIDGVEFATDNVAYNDNIIYDENGNPLNIDFQEFEWTNGRQLKSITYHFTDGTSKKGLEYTYDENGLRTSKNFGIYKYDYIYDGDKLIAELKTDPDNGNYLDRKEYFYDGNDEVIGFTRRNGQYTYFYLKDAEGNIIGFTNSNGNILGLYDYDAWGKVSHRYSLSWENPLTYRGYYYDDENMVYYLQSRYYNPQWGRFLNADLPDIAQQSKDEINGLNLFAYCCNNPVNNSDPTGYDSTNNNSIKVYLYGKKGLNIFGHIDICYKNYTYSYGNNGVNGSNYLIEKATVHYNNYAYRISDTCTLKLSKNNVKRLKKFLNKTKKKSTVIKDSDNTIYYKLNMFRFKHYQFAITNCATFVFYVFYYIMPVKTTIAYNSLYNSITLIKTPSAVFKVVKRIKYLYSL